MWDLHDSGDPEEGTLVGTLRRGPCADPHGRIPPPDGLRVRGESVEAGPAGGKEPGFGEMQMVRKTLAKRIWSE